MFNLSACMESRYCLMLLRTVLFYLQEILFGCAKLFTVRIRFNEPLYNEVLVITNDILRPSNSKIYGKKSRYSLTKHSYVVGNISWPFFISRYHCNCFISIGKYPKRLQENGRLRVYFNKNLNSMTTRFRKTMVTSRCLILKRNLGDPFAIYNRNRLLSRTCRAALFKARLS